MGEMVLLLETLRADVRVAVENDGELFALVERFVEEAIEAGRPTIQGTGSPRRVYDPRCSAGWPPTVERTSLGSGGEGTELTRGITGPIGNRQTSSTPHGTASAGFSRKRFAVTTRTPRSY